MQWLLFSDDALVNKEVVTPSSLFELRRAYARLF